VINRVIGSVFTNALFLFVKGFLVATPHHPVLLAHYLPWYTSKPFRGQWGWHWTMNHFDPDKITGKRRPLASRFYPLIGPYDSGDPDTLQCHAMLLKIAGIDGVIIDWYGKDPFLDYAANNRNAQALVPFLEKAGLKFALCYEDQTVPKEIEGKVFAASEAVAHGQELMRWTEKNYFASPAYLRQDGRPVLLSFGKPYYDDAQWNEIFSVLSVKPLYFTENDRRAATASVGGFDWPAPSGGANGAFREQDAFYARAKNWPHFIPAAFPRFDDIYAQAGVHASWGKVEDRNGKTYVETLTKALQSKAPLVQLVTWNDWGEGTQIEPSVEFGYRDLEATQQKRRERQAAFPYRERDLRLPVEWYLARKRLAGNKVAYKSLGAVFALMVSGRADKARALLAKYQ